MDAFVQFLASGITRGAIYALCGAGFAIIYNASNVINFAQGEFVMLGGMISVFLAVTAQVLPLPVAIALAILATSVIGAAVYRLAVEPSRNANVATIIIITIGVSILLRGLVEVTLGKQDFSLPAFSGGGSWQVFGASVGWQNLWVLAGAALVVVFLKWFFDGTLIGKAMLATAQNRRAAELMGIDVRMILMISFALSAAIGALAGALITPIALTRYDVGIMLGMKGFAASMLGGLGGPFGAVAGGLILGLIEGFAGGYISSAYQDVVAFVIILFVLFVRPSGLFGRAQLERV